MVYLFRTEWGSKATVQLSELGVRIYGAELPTKSPPRLRRAQDFGASDDGAKLRVQILKS